MMYMFQVNFSSLSSLWCATYLADGVDMWIKCLIMDMGYKLIIFAIRMICLLVSKGDLCLFAVWLARKSLCRIRIAVYCI